MGKTLYIYGDSWNLESVGTLIAADGWTYPLTVDGGYDNDAGAAHHISNIDPNDAGCEWWQSLSDYDRKIVESVLEQIGGVNHE